MRQRQQRGQRLPGQLAAAASGPRSYARQLLVQVVRQALRVQLAAAATWVLLQGLLAGQASSQAGRAAKAAPLLWLAATQQQQQQLAAAIAAAAQAAGCRGACWLPPLLPAALGLLHQGATAVAADRTASISCSHAGAAATQSSSSPRRVGRTPAAAQQGRRVQRTKVPVLVGLGMLLHSAPPREQQVAALLASAPSTAAAAAAAAEAATAGPAAVLGAAGSSMVAAVRAVATLAAATATALCPMGCGWAAAALLLAPAGCITPAVVAAAAAAGGTAAVGRLSSRVVLVLAAVVVAGLASRYLHPGSRVSTGGREGHTQRQQQGALSSSRAGTLLAHLPWGQGQ